jgi:hypothetical protein
MDFFGADERGLAGMEVAGGTVFIKGMQVAEGLEYAEERCHHVLG